MINKKSLNLYIIILLVVAAFLALADYAMAVEPLLEDNNDAKYNPGCIDSGNCQLNDFMIVFIRISQIILGVTGALALLAFVAGGVMFLLSAGNKNMVDRGKATIIGAVIGLVIVFTSYTIINFICQKLGITNSVFTSSWF